MRVIVVNSVLMGGGVDTHTLSLCRALLGQGAEVSLMIREGSRWVERARAIDGLDVQLMRVGRLAWPLALAWQVRARRAQIVHAHHGRDYWVCQLGAWLSRSRAKVVATRHLMTPLKPKTARRLAPSTALIAVSDAVEAAIRASSHGHALEVRRIHCGIDTHSFRRDPDRRAAMRAQLGYAPDEIVFAVIGPVFLPDGKGQFNFLQAAAPLADKQPNARFLCVGYGDGASALTELAAKLKLAERFQFLPFSDDIVGLLQAIDVLVHPAVSSEALGLVILEALSCEKWVIASQLDGIAETFVDGDHGRMVAPGCIASLTTAMQEAVTLQEARHCRARSRQWVTERFSLETLGRTTLHFYSETLKRLGPGARPVR